MDTAAGYAAMLELVMGLPEQLAEAGTRCLPAGIPGRRGWSTVVVVGMGGSAISGDIARSLMLDSCAVPVISCRDYDIPAAVTKRTLLVALSYSGNTEETLSAYRQAVGTGCRRVVVTSGGELARLARAEHDPVIAVPSGIPPRAALGYLLGSLLPVLEHAGLGEFRGQLDEAVGLLAARRDAWRRRAVTLAARLVDRLPLVLSTSRLLDCAADRWRCQLNENAKVICHTSRLPEHNHNEVVGMGRPAELAQRTVIIGLLERETHPRTSLRLRHVLAIARDGYEQAVRLRAEGRSPLARVLSLSMLGDLVSVELARLTGVDPMPVRRIDKLKRRLARARRE
ncbi:bifunctional phosphoglucose/phosphomannose isomerase [candidate division WOR-3 bacterium]|nr:bifunctional phosphoglucose/phosphomannose isomerase [candidate division WOR-3 bacterium]